MKIDFLKEEVQMKQEVIKMKFNLNDYQGNYAMHCKTKEEAESFCRFLHQNGRRWRSGRSYLDEDHWDEYEDDTIYFFNECIYDERCSDFEEDYIILEWSDFIENTETASEFTLDDLKPGDFVKFEDGSVCCVLFVHAKTFKYVALEYSTGEIRYTTFFYGDSGALVGVYGDIAEIRRPTHLSDVCYTIFDDEKGCLLYTREEEGMTLDEVCKALGRKIKIVEK